MCPVMIINNASQLIIRRRKGGEREGEREGGKEGGREGGKEREKGGRWIEGEGWVCLKGDWHLASLPLFK